MNDPQNQVVPSGAPTKQPKMDGDVGPIDVAAGFQIEELANRFVDDPSAAAHCGGCNGCSGCSHSDVHATDGKGS